jgi:hypothetical protein
MGLSPKTITVDIPINDLVFRGGASSLTGAALERAVLPKVESAVAAAIGGTAASVLFWGGVAAGIGAWILYETGNEGIKVVIYIGVETKTKHQAGQTFKYDAYVISDFDVNVY